jgi:hypothetical protein
MSEEIKHHRRFLAAGAMTIAAVLGISLYWLGMSGSADTQSSKINLADVPAIKPATNTSFALLKQIDAGVTPRQFRTPARIA